MVNVPLLRKTVEWVEADMQKPYQESEWDQNRWFHLINTNWYCKTTCCVAGKVAFNDGWTPVYQSVAGMLTGEYVRKDQTVQHVREVARDLLDVTDYEADCLFDASNSAQSIRSIAENLAGERL